MTKVDEKLMQQICGHLPKEASEERAAGEQMKDGIAPGFPEALERLNVMAELREAADLWMHAYVGMYVIHYGPEKLASMMADPIEGKRHQGNAGTAGANGYGRAMVSARAWGSARGMRRILG